MSEEYNEGYFGWLVSLVERNARRSSGRGHWSLLSQLHTKPFRWFVGNDDNRNSDGKDLREEFLREFDIQDDDRQWLEPDASVLEVLIALARRASFEAYSGTPAEWFWTLISNLELKRYTDNAYNGGIGREVDEVLERFLDRRYNEDGRGGLFPLRDARNDQRTIELWYQMSAYLLESEYVDNGP